MKYIRTNYLFGEIISHTKLSNGTHLFSIKGLDEILPISEEDFKKCKVAGTIDELMMVGDLVFKKNGDIFVIVNQAYIDYYIKHKSVGKLFIKDSKGNYIRVAEENEKGELELL